MGWLEDSAKTTIYNYKPLDDNDPCNKISGTKEQLSEYFGVGVEGVPGETLSCPQTEYQYLYGGFEPKSCNIMTKVTFEKNGRKGVRTIHGDGKHTIRSMSRENLLKGKGVTFTGDKHDSKGEKTGKKSYEVESVKTKACQEATDKVQKEMVYNKVKDIRKQIETNTRRKK